MIQKKQTGMFRGPNIIKQIYNSTLEKKKKETEREAETDTPHIQAATVVVIAATVVLVAAALMSFQMLIP